MLTFSINTSSPEKSVSLIRDGKTVFKKSWEKPAVESSMILPSLLAGLKKINANLESLTGITVESGPGSFSSVRIGVTIANALSYALRIPVTALPSKKKGFPVVPFYDRPPSITPPKKPYKI